MKREDVGFASTSCFEITIVLFFCHQQVGSKKADSSFIADCSSKPGKKPMKSSTKKPAVGVGSRNLSVYRNILSHLQNYPELYDKSSPDYKNNSVRKEKWEELADAINSRVSTLKKQVTRLRVMYAEERQKESSDWTLFEESRFLEKLYTESSSTDSELDNDDGSSSAFSEYFQIIENDSSSVSANTRKRRRIEDEETPEVSSSDQIHHNDLNESINLDSDQEMQFGHLPEPPQDQPQLLQLTESQRSDESIIIHSNELLEPKIEVHEDNVENEAFQEPIQDQNEDYNNNPNNMSASEISFASHQPQAFSTQIVQQHNVSGVNGINASFCDYLAKELDSMPELKASAIRFQISQLLFMNPNNY
jgi:hypothetical protein